MFTHEKGCSCRNANAAMVECPKAGIGGILRTSSFGDGVCGRTSDSCCIDAIAQQNSSHSTKTAFYSSLKNADSSLPADLLPDLDRLSQMFPHGCGCIGNDLVDRFRQMRRSNNVSSKCDSCDPSLQLESLYRVSNAEAYDARNIKGTISNCSASDWIRRSLIDDDGAQARGLGGRRKSYADILQMGLGQPDSSRLPRAVSYNSFNEISEERITQSLLTDRCDSAIQFEGLSPREIPSRLLCCSLNRCSHGLTPELASILLRSTECDTQQANGSYDLQLGKDSAENICAHNSTFQNGRSSSLTSLDRIGARSLALRLYDENVAELDTCMQAKLPKNHQYLGHDQSLPWNNCQHKASNHLSGNCIPGNLASLGSSEGVRLPRKSFSSANLRSNVHPIDSGVLDGSISQTENGSMLFLSRSLSFDRESNSDQVLQLNKGSRENGNKRNSYNTQIGNKEVISDSNSYLRRGLVNENHATGSSYVRHLETQLCNPIVDENDARKAYIKLLLARQDKPHELHFLGKSSGLGKINHGNQFHENDVKCSYNSMEGLESSSMRNEPIGNFSMSGKSERALGSSDVGFKVEKRKLSSLLEEFKSNKLKSLKLSDIVNHAVEFSKDQHGSRFIQQKLETASTFEKEKIFPEILLYAHTLMTDVFGNYVIQKLFEHGTPGQIAELINKLSGHVLPLSLQMYGCRVIQKSLEVVDVSEQTRLVQELYGSVMKCVKDQNGNHVIQKCIECLPEDKIHFIVSAIHGHVTALSCHPYGCRVIQRILERCENTRTRQFVMDEIMASVSMSSQDQYGNYVIQHILEHGMYHEKSAIIRKLAGQILTMSRQKFASNVVEKCLIHGHAEDRQLLVHAMLGSSPGNDPLKAMMEDPYGNYVVQKTLETCSDASLELILSRIKNHLTALKKLTYGKHIVSRIEKLLSTGERRIGMPDPSNSSAPSL